MRMTKRERLTAAIFGEEVDRVPVSLWRHFPADDTNPEQLALSVASFQQEYDWDFIKLTPLSNYSVADWGGTIAYQGNPEGTSDYVTPPLITRPEDWSKLKPLNSHSGHLGDQITCLQRLRELVGPDVPIIETVFSPLSQVKRLVGRGAEIVHLRRYPQALGAALELITTMTISFVEAALAAGADGIFYAVQHASADLLSVAEYQAILRPLDLRILEAARGGGFNLLHLHGLHTYFDLFTDYPIHALNWHDRDTGPSLSEGAQRFPGLVVGGLSQRDMIEGNPETIRKLVQETITSSNGRRICLSTGCVLPTVAPWGNIRALRAAVEEATP